MKRFLQVTTRLPSQATDGDDSDEVYGSDDPFVRILESTYKVLELAT